MSGHVFRIIIAGGRDFINYSLLEEKLDRAFKGRTDIEIVSGCARGADRLGEQYAAARGLNVARFPADWNRYGRGAGYIRNAEMANYADILIAFHDGKSPGTANMIDVARKKGLKVIVVNYEP